MEPFLPNEGEFFKLYNQKEIEEQSLRNGIIATYGGSKENQYGNSHLVSVIVQINGSSFFSNTCIQLKLTQKINADHEFILTADPGEFDESDAYLLQNTRQYLGNRITFTFRQFGKAASVWMGIISSISSKKKDGIKKIIIKGKSPAMLMENGLHCRSFEDKTFEEIVMEVTESYSQNMINFDVNPNFKGKLKYTTQYNQTDFQFLRSLASRYGEYLYFSGEKFNFSAWGSRIIELTEGEDVYDYELKIEAQPQKFSYITYDPKQSSDYTIDSESQPFQQSENPFQQSAVNTSESLFTVIPTSHFEHSLLHKNQVDVEQAVLRQRKKQQNLVYMEAVSNNPEIRIGDIAKMNVYMPGHKTFKSGKTPVESYRVIEIVHNFSDGEGYTNTFIGVPKDLSVPTYYNEKDNPKADIQHATVTDNKDPLRMGRIRVQFVWQKKNNQQTPWIQVIQPHGGSGKGTYINPEIGETVLVAFQGGNAEAPIVLGTAYNGGEIADYYTEGNDIKVIQTRSGAKIIFNDAQGQGSILIEDPSGNKVFLDGEGNITATAPKNFNINAGEDINLNAGGNMNTFIGANKSTTIGQMNLLNVGANYTLNVSGKYSEFIDGDLISESKKQRKEVSAKNFEILSKDVISKNAEQQVKNNSGEKSNFF